MSGGILTPETEGPTHCFWASARDFRTDDTDLSRQLFEGITAAFTLEDEPMIEAQQEIGSVSLAGARLTGAAVRKGLTADPSRVLKFSDVAPAG
jgi:hypothetical protein